MGRNLDADPSRCCDAVPVVEGKRRELDRRDVCSVTMGSPLARPAPPAQPIAGITTHEAVLLPDASDRLVMTSRASAQGFAEVFYR